MSVFQSLLNEEIWSPSKEKEVRAPASRISIAYERARSLCQQSGLSIEDIHELKKPFWDFHYDLIVARDPIVFMLASIHINLCIGTISGFRQQRPELSTLLEKLLKFDVCGAFMLTELGHGLDARNLETTATLQEDGSFDLHTPTEAAAKVMPSSTPQCGLPRIAVVCARLIVEGEDRGVRPFLVWLNDSSQMQRGVTSRTLPNLCGTKPLDHSITTFNHVRLSSKALLGSMTKPKDERVNFLRLIWRINVGTLALGMTEIPVIKLGAHIAAMYSNRRLVSTANGHGSIPIMSFSTQHRPILEAWVQGTVLESYARWSVKAFMSPETPKNVKYGLAICFKATTIQASSILNQLAERCGWRGLFACNQLSEMAMISQANSIGEGDTLVLSIVLASELLGEKYHLPEPINASTPLALHEIGVFNEAKEKLIGLGGYGKHRDETFNLHILPRCRYIIESIGSRMAYEAAKDEGVSSEILSLFEKIHMRRDLSWYIENGHTSRRVFEDATVEAYELLVPEMLKSMHKSELNNYVTAPMASDELWNDFIQGLPKFQFESTDGGNQPEF